MPNVTPSIQYLPFFCSYPIVDHLFNLLELLFVVGLSLSLSKLVVILFPILKPVFQASYGEELKTSILAMVGSNKLTLSLQLSSIINLVSSIVSK